MLYFTYVTISTSDSESGFVDVADEPGPMSLSVKGEVRDGQTASVSCSVTHFCPTSPPVFTWSHLGLEGVQHSSLERGLLRTTSTLSFQPSRGDHNKPLWCSVRYKGGQQQETRLLLKVMCKYVIAANLGKHRKETFFSFFLSVFTDVPEIRNISHCTSTAKVITCMCIVESNPPSRLQFLLSNRIMDSTITTTNGTVTMGILQAEQGPHKFIHCLANNTLGRVNLKLSLTLLHSNVFFNLSTHSA